MKPKSLKHPQPELNQSRSQGLGIQWLFMGLFIFTFAAMGISQAAPKTKLSQAKDVSQKPSPKQKVVASSAPSDGQILTEARQAFKSGDFAKASRTYAKIPLSSDRWSLAREEMAWSSVRNREYQAALAQVRSLTNDYVKTQIDLEPFLLQSIVQLYSCDYQAVFKTLQETKRLMSDYVAGIEALAKNQPSSDQLAIFERLSQEKTITHLTPADFQVLPRKFHLDRIAHDAILKGQRQILQTRLVNLAKAENDRNHKTLQHLHLVEVEAIQRAFVPNQFGEKKLTQIPDDKNLMIFNGDQELWADEVDKTQADVFVCANKTGRTL